MHHLSPNVKRIGQTIELARKVGYWFDWLHHSLDRIRLIEPINDRTNLARTDWGKSINYQFCVSYLYRHTHVYHVLHMGIGQILVFNT